LREDFELFFARERAEIAAGTAIGSRESGAVCSEVFAEGPAELAVDVVGCAGPGSAGILVGWNYLVAEGRERALLGIGEGIASTASSSTCRRG
jgi:hypothetical protein